MALPLTYNWRNLFVRKLSTALTFCVVAVVVAVLAVLLSFTEGIKASLRAAGSPRNIIVLTVGATAESTSILNPEDCGKLVQTPGVAMDDRGAPMLSHELCVQTSIRRRGTDGKPANVAIRGIEPVAWQVHQEVKIVEGRNIHEGATEIIVGKAASERYENLQIGKKLELGRTTTTMYEVVGIFEADGSAFESEVWTSLGMLKNLYGRPFVSSVVLRLADEGKANKAIEYIGGPAVNLSAKLESTYYEELSSKSTQIVALTSILIAIMATGAVFAVANTMYAAVDGRRREIAMLRTIGFTRAAILTSFVVESLMICLVACGLGLLGASFASGKRQDFLSDTTWTVMAYELTLTPAIIAVAVIVSTLVGVVGALAPAAKASRISILEALRKA